MLSRALFFFLLAPLLVVARPVEFDGLELRAGAGLRELVQAAEHDDAARLWRRQEPGSNGTTTAVPAAASSADLASSAVPSLSTSAEPATSSPSDPTTSSTAEPEPTSSSSAAEVEPAPSSSAAAPSSSPEPAVSSAQQPETTSQTPSSTTITSATPETTSSAAPETSSEPVETTSSAPIDTTTSARPSSASPPTTSAAPVTTTSRAQTSRTTPPTTTSPATTRASQTPLDPTTQVVVVTPLPTGQRTDTAAEAGSQTTTLPAGATGVEVITLTQYLTSGGSTFVNTAAGIETVVIPVYPAGPSASSGIEIVTIFVDPNNGETGAVTTDVVSERTTTDGAGIVVVETVTAPIILTRVARATDPSLQTGTSAARSIVTAPLATGLLAVAGTTLFALCRAL